MTSVYCRVLKERAELLRPLLRQFLTNEHPVRAIGRLRVTRSGGVIRSLVASLLRLPPSGECDVCLDVEPRGDAQKWVRSFGGHVFATVQTDYGGLLLESSGPVGIGFELIVKDGGLIFRTRHVWVCGIRLPACCQPAADAENIPDESGWHVQVRIRVPLLGQLVQYEGHVVPAD